MADTFAQRLDYLIRRLHGHRGASAFARQSGIGDSTLRNYLSGRSQPTLDNLVAIAEAGGVSLEWLAGLVDDEAATAPRPPLGIPVVGEIPAGALVERYVAEHPEEFVPLDPASLGQEGDILFGLRVDGDSMIGAGILPGDIAICSSYQQVQVGDDVAFYQHETGKSTIKRLTLLNIRQRYAQLTPIHPTLRPFRVELKPGDQLKKVLRVWRDLGSRL